MKSPPCTQNRWGSGTTCDKQPTTEGAKEIKDRLAAVMAERNKQDSMWLEPPATESKKEVTNSNINNTKPKSLS